MPARLLSVDEIMTILPETPGRIARWTEGLTATQLHAPPEPGAWSVSDVLAHLRACHDVLGVAMVRIVTEDHPAWRRVSPRAWIRKTDYPEWEFSAALAAFREKRGALVPLLESLSPEGWERTATVMEPGKTMERSVRFYGDWMAAHERVHWQQIGRIASPVRDKA